MLTSSMQMESTLAKPAGKLSEKQLKRMLLPSLYWSSTMDQVRPEDSVHRLQVQRYLEKLPAMLARGGGLYLWGPNRHGKTALMAIILKAARQLRSSGLYLRTSDLMTLVNERERYDESTTVMARAKRVGILGLDDLGKEHRTKSHAFSERITENLLRTRAEDRLVTIVTSNINPHGKDGKPSQLATIYPDSMVRLMREVLFVVPVSGHDYGAELGAELKAELEGDHAGA